MKAALLAVVLVCLLVISHGLLSKKAECPLGARKTVDCNTCVCVSGEWRCSQRACEPQHRAKRGVPVAADLKNTPCAPNDYFKIDCNTCYCNIDKTGYLCTENLCSFTELAPSNNTAANHTTTSNPVTVTNKNDSVADGGGTTNETQH